MTSTLRVWSVGNTLVITIPKVERDFLGIKKNDVIEVTFRKLGNSPEKKKEDLPKMKKMKKLNKQEIPKFRFGR